MLSSGPGRLLALADVDVGAELADDDCEKRLLTVAVAWGEVSVGAVSRLVPVQLQSRMATMVGLTARATSLNDRAIFPLPVAIGGPLGPTAVRPSMATIANPASSLSTGPRFVGGRRTASTGGAAAKPTTDTRVVTRETRRPRLVVHTQWTLSTHVATLDTPWREQSPPPVVHRLSTDPAACRTGQSTHLAHRRVEGWPAAT